MANNNITNEKIFDLMKMAIQVENGMRFEAVLSIETLNNMSTMLMYFRKFLSIDVDPVGELVQNLNIAKDTFSDPSISKERKEGISNMLRFEFKTTLKKSEIAVFYF